MALSKEKFWSVDNVASFQGFSITNGEINLTDEEYGDWIDEIYPSVRIAGIEFTASQILRECDPVAWRCGMGERECEIQSELEYQLDREDDSDIEWIDEERDESDDD